MTLQSFIALALLIVNIGVGAVSIRSPAHHSQFSKRATLKHHNGPCITAASNANGAPVVVGSCSSGQWTLPSSGSGMIHIFGDKCLDVKDGKNQNGAKLQIWTCNNGPSQKFSLSDGQIHWKGTDKCLDLTDGKTAAGTPIQLWQCVKGNSNQEWNYPAHSSGSPSSGSGSGGNLFGSKIILAYPDGNLDELLGLTPAKTYYNWHATADNLSSMLSQHGIHFLPQLWGWKNKWEFDQVAKHSNAPLFLGMNECNEPGQSNMSPESGIQLWRSSMKPLRDRGKKVCSPAMSGNPNGIKWMKTFSEKCGRDCHFDYTCVHWYDTTFEKFKDWVEKWHELYPHAPILVTEFAPQNFNGGAQPSHSEVWEFYSQAIPWALSQDYVHGIAPYGFMRDININSNARLLNSDGSPNSLGKFILGHA